MSTKIKHSLQSQSSIGIPDILAFLRFARLRMLLGAIIAALLAGIYLMVTPTLYTAYSSVLYDPVSSPSFLQDSRWLESGIEMAIRIDSQVEVIKSEGLAATIVKRLDLMSDPEFVPEEFIDQSKMESAAGEKTEAKEKPDQEKIETANSDERVGTDLALQSFLSRLAVRRVGLSSVMEIAFTAEEPEKAVAIVNGIAKTYIASSIAQKTNAAQNGTNWLQGRLKQLRKLAFEAMREAEQFKSVGAGTVSDSAVKLAELESIAQTYRRIYETFLLKLIETEQRVSFPVADARIVSLATPTRVTARPKKKLMLIFAIVLGAGLGLGVSFAQRALDPSVKSTRKLAEQGISTLGSVKLHQPRRADKAKLARRPAKGSGHSPSDWGRNLSGQQQPHKNRSANLDSLLAPGVLPETSEILLATLGEQSYRYIGIFGLSNGAGASTLSAKLAQNSVAAGFRTLLVDGDLTGRNLSQHFDVDDRSGFVDVILGDIKPAETIIDDMPGGFHLMPAGKTNDLVSTPVVKLKTKHAALSLSDVVLDYELSLFDLAPLNTHSDTRIIAPLLDAVVIIAEYDVTQTAELVEAVEELEATGATVRGVILNKAPGI